MQSIHLLTFLRHLRKNRVIAVINILSYGLGIATCLFLLQHIYYETSYDKFFNDHERIYRITMDSYFTGVYQNSSACTYIPIGPELKERYPEVQEFTVLQNRTNDVVTVGDDTYLEKSIIAADVNFFKVFSHNMIAGSTELVKPNDVFISETIATKYFGNANPIGNIIQILSESYTVKGVFADLPVNTHLKFHIVYILPVRESNDWNVAYMYTYVRLDGDPHGFEQKLKSFSEEFSPLANQQSEGDVAFQLKVQPLASIHLESELLAEFEINGRMKDVYILTVIIILILTITCFNYINITNAVNSERSKEIFIKKIHGASYHNTIIQHVTESLVMNAIGFAAAVMFLVAISTWISPLLNINTVSIDWTNPLHYYTLSAIFIIALILSGILPAILTLQKKSWQFLYKSFGTPNIKMAFARNITLVQFIVCFILISAAAVVLKQLRFMQEGDIGFHYEDVVAVEVLPVSYRNNEQHFLKLKDDLQRIASVEEVAFSSSVPGEKLFGIGMRLSDEPSETVKNGNVQVVTSDYFKLYGLELLAGRLFSESMPGDEHSVVINEALARHLDGPDYKNILNKQIAADYARRLVNFTIVGVIKDYYHDTRKEAIQPMIFIPLKNSFAVFRISIRKNAKADWQANTALIQKALKDNLTEPYSGRGVGVAFDLIDVETNYLANYTRDQQFSKYINALAMLALIMTGIGLFSLAATAVRKRTKEMAIRKVHGAKVADVAILQLNYFLRLAGIALLIALPVSYYFVQNWLESFPVRIGIDHSFVIAPVSMAVGLILVSVMYHLLKVAFINPVQHLRNE